MGQACLGLIAAQHSGDLCGTGVSRHLVQMRLGNIAGFLAHHVVLIGHNGDLRQVRNDYHLMRRGKIGQHTSKSTSRGAADLKSAADSISDARHPILSHACHFCVSS